MPVAPLAEATRTSWLPNTPNKIQALLRALLNYPEGVAILEALHQVEMPLFGLTNGRQSLPYARANYPFLKRFATSWCLAR